MRTHEQAVIRAFDLHAVRYDEEFESSESARTQRKKILDLVTSLVPTPSSILDMNCGTGTDAIFLATKGHDVLGIDISRNMILHATRKLGDRRNVRFRQHSFCNLHDLGEAKFDLVLSNFGGLNCTNDLPTITAQVSFVLRPGGCFVAVVMPPFSPWHFAAALLRGQLSGALERAVDHRQNAVMGPESFSVTYHSARELTRALQPTFRRVTLFSLNTISPPPNARRFVRRFPVVSHALRALDERFGSIPLYRCMGDHYAAVFRKEKHR